MESETNHNHFVSIHRIEHEISPKAKMQILRYKIHKELKTSKFVLSKDLFTSVLELQLSYKKNKKQKLKIFKGLEVEIFNQIAQYQKTGVYQTVLLFI